MIETVRTFSALSEEFVECTMRHDPVAATAAGIHDYDHQLPDDSPDGFRARGAWLLDLEQRLLASVPWEELPPEQRVDYAVLRSRLATLRAELEEIRVQAHDPARYPETALRGVFLLLVRPFALLQERKESVIARMMAVPDYLGAATRTLAEVPAEALENAREINSCGPEFVDDVVRSLIRSFPGEDERIEHAGGRARSGFTAYQGFLEQELAARAPGTFVLGERWMNFKLEREHMLGLDVAALEDFGREQAERTERALEEEARRIDPAQSWRVQIAAARQRHVEPLRLRDDVLAEVARAQRFVAERRLAPVPDGPLEVVDTPLFERAETPLAGYLPPAPFDIEATGTLFLTPIDVGRRAELQAQQLEGHNEAALPLLAADEVCPGRHLQRCAAARAGSRMRRLCPSALFAEGWALAARDLMHEHGFFTDGATRLQLLHDLLGRAWRIVLDVRLHTGGLGLGEAADQLVEHTLIDRATAAIEVRRLALSPAQSMAGLVGRSELQRIREEARRRAGSRFDLHDFHVALLAGGTLPPTLVREELWPRWRFA